jgi:hypothetical protein
MLSFRLFRHRRLHHEARAEQVDVDEEDAGMGEICPTIFERIFAPPLDRVHPVPGADVIKRVLLLPGFSDANLYSGHFPIFYF